MSTCSTITVISGDSCASLATRCGITTTEFYDYNPATDLCSTLAVGELICCTSGSLPDLAPSPYANGTCYTYLVESGDSCSAIASTYTITVDDIESYNSDTWGWLGCTDLQADQNICLSTGTPPFPAAVSNAECGPQVPGTTEPTNGTDWALLNLCPLNACCDIWGECGTTPEFCTISNSTTGAPGTAAIGANGCISNCGTDIVVGSGPSEYAAMGFYEGFNSDRPCLTMNVYDIDTASYTHVLYAFGNITTDFEVNDGGYTTQFAEFLQLSGVQRIITFGGWDFSTNPSTYMIFREGVTAANRGILAQNVVNFVSENGLDGVDFDWEYPGATDIPGIPPASADDGANYLAFLTELRSLLPTGKSISIAAPASYWYLKNFPIDEIAEVVDFIVYMTYDFQGIWDLGNSNEESGCTLGNCLRSDVNLTETVYSLSMITKAGVPSNQVIVGVTSYGRSFTMSAAGCSGSDCTYTSAGDAGECTQTAGYLANAEINEIIANNPTAESLIDAGSDTDILIYNSTQWVGYMSAETKTTRIEVYEAWNMGGTVDWAIDLQAFESGNLATSCIAGTGININLTDLCAYACQYDYCPTNACDCTQTGDTVTPPEATYPDGYAAAGVDSALYSDLCDFSCSRGYCPAAYCTWNPPAVTVVVTIGTAVPTNIVTYLA